MKLAIELSEHVKSVIDRFANGTGCDVLPTPIVDDVIWAVRNGTPLAEPCEDTINRKHLLSEIDDLMKSPWFNNGKDDDMFTHYGYVERKEAVEVVRDLCVKAEPPVTPKQKLCKDCKFFEYDSIAKVDGIPLIVAHEICNKWGDGCKTKEDGYCFLFEPKMKGE